MALLRFLKGVWALLRARITGKAHLVASVQEGVATTLRTTSQPLKALDAVEEPLEDLFQSSENSSTSPAEVWLKGEILQEMKRFLQNQRSHHTQRAYEGDLKQFISYLRAERLAGDSFDALLTFREWLVRPEELGGRGLTRISANRKFATVRAFLGWLQARGKVKENPSLWVKNFRAKTESPTQGFSDREVAHMLEIPDANTASGRMHSVVLHLLFYLGLRRGELVALRASNVGWARTGEHNVMTLRVPGKGDKERILPLPARTQAVLEQYMERKGIRAGGNDYLFSPVRNNVTHTKDRPIASEAIYYIVKKYASLAGIDRKVSPHSCRATCISNALDHAASHRSVQQLAGWSSPLMIERYDKRRTQLKDSAVHLVEY